MTFNALSRQGQPSFSDPSLWANLISTAWQKAAESIIETGRLLNEAKKALDRGDWLPMVEKLPFSERAAQMLMKIAEHPILSNPKHVSYLPPSWGTLYELSKLPDSTLATAIETGVVTPAMQRKDAIALRPALLAATTAPDPAKVAEVLLGKHGPIWFSDFASAVARLADIHPQLSSDDVWASDHVGNNTRH